MAESLNGISKGRGGARAGAGRPRGTVEPQTLERHAIKAAFLNRVAKNADKLFNAQLDKAIGEKFLMRKVTERDGKGKVLRVYHEVVEDPDLIIQYLDDDTALNADDEYYYMSTRAADNQAIQGLLDRGFGKATEKVELGNDPDNPLTDPTAPQTAVDTFIAQLKANGINQTKPD